MRTIDDVISDLNGIADLLEGIGNAAVSDSTSGTSVGLVFLSERLHGARAELEKISGTAIKKN